MKTLAVVAFVMLVGATGCSPWPKSNENWSGSWGLASSIVTDSVSSSAAAPSPAEETDPSARQIVEAKKPKKKPAPPLGAQTVCAMGSERRTLAMTRQKLGCQLSYQNRSHVEIVAEATWGKQVCQQIRSQIVQKLRSAGYSCG